MPAPGFAIAGRPIGPDHPPYVIAELSANHLGRYDRAIAIIDAAADAGADAVKLQTYRAETMTLPGDGPGFRIEGGLWDGRTLHDLYLEAATPWEWHAPLFAHARARGLHVFSSPFDTEAVALLERLDAPALKIASFELVDLALVAAAAQTGRPLIMSTGMAALDDAAEALACARAHGARAVALLHCVSGYPTPPDQANLGMLATLRARFGVTVGLSDHSPGHLVAALAVGLGASIVEKHLTLARADGGPDGAFSMEPAEFAELVRGCRTAWAATRPQAGRSAAEAPSMVFRRSLYAVEDIPAGAPLTVANVRAIRPGLGLQPRHLPALLASRASRFIPRGTPLAWEHVVGAEAPEPVEVPA
ncbi:MAG: pseudaminic acid synthase [Gemmatimonadales bacterium]|nr:pseudaminic acid synthase [Gemmatimonadales bacterium]